MRVKRSTIKMILSKRKDVKTLTDLRFILALHKTGLKSVKGRPENTARIMTSGLSWQKRLEWATKINNFQVKKVESLEWLTILYNDRSLAEQMMKTKSDRVSGKNNPAYQHNGKLSPFSKKSKSYDPTLSKRVNDRLNESGNRSNRIEYYLMKGTGLCQAISMLKERQAVGRLDKFIQRYGQEEGTKRWNDRQAKWLKSYKKTNFSKVSQELFYAIVDSGLVTTSNIYFATFDRSDMCGYVNKEYTLKLKSRSIKPDFIDVDKKMIIEFDGDYWHSSRVANPSRELERDNSILAEGFKLLRVKESDYKKNKEKVIQECIDFLTQ